MTQPQDDQHLQATIALHAADEASNTSSQAATINLVGATIVYLSISSLALANQDKIPDSVLAFLALPIVLIQTYQMALAASVMRRAKSARFFEENLLRYFDKNKVSSLGSTQSNSVRNWSGVAGEPGVSAGQLGERC